MSEAAAGNRSGILMPLILAVLGGGGLVTLMTFVDKRYSCGEANWVIERYEDNARNAPILVAGRKDSPKLLTAVIQNFGPDNVTVTYDANMTGKPMLGLVDLPPHNATTVTGSNVVVQLAYLEKDYEVEPPDEKGRPSYRVRAPGTESWRSRDAIAACGKFEIK